MSRLYADVVDVRQRDDTPQQFLWRGRLYLVREVLAHWTEAGLWWQGSAARAMTEGASAQVDGAAAGSRAGDLVLAPIPASPQWAQRAWGEPAPDVGASIGPIGVDDRERDYWRVAAGAGRSAGTGVFDLCFNWSSGIWAVTRALD